MAKLVNIKQIRVEDLSLDSIFQSEFWAKVKAPLWRSFAFSFSFETKGGELLVLVRSLCPFFSIAYIPFGPIERLDKFELVSLSKALKSKLPKSVSLLRFDLPFSYEFEITKPFHKCRESVQADATVKINLDSDYRLHSRAKRNIAKTKDCFTIEKTVAKDDIALWYKTYVETGLRDGFQTRSLPYINKLIESKTKLVTPILYLAKHNGEIMGGILNLRGVSEEVYLFGATVKTDDNLSPGYLLQYNAMNEAKKVGIKSYDMFGIEGKDGRGEHLKTLTMFKTAFGGKKYYRTPTFDFYYHKFLSICYRLMENIRYIIYRKKH